MKSLIKIVIYSLIIFFCSPTFAGDYCLWVLDEGSTNCASPIASRDNSWNPIRTSDEVIEDLKRYFSSKKIENPILVMAFTNGHIMYCSISSRRKVYESLIDTLTWPEISSNINDLYGLISLQSNKRMLKIIDQKIKDINDNEKIVLRLEKAKKLVERSLENLGI